MVCFLIIFYFIFVLGSLQDFIDSCKKFGTEISEEVEFLVVILDNLFFFHFFQRVLKIFCQLVVAVALFHKQRFVHHDLKPGNIFMDENLNAIIGMGRMFFCMFLFGSGDFGEARSFTVDHTSTITALGSMMYMAPEILKDEKFFFFFFNFFVFVFRHSFPCDVWSLGVILYKVRKILY
jgi:serine/threonine protein kinase